MSTLRFPYAEFRFPTTPAFGRQSRFRPFIPVSLAHAGHSEEVYALIDSGADTTVFSNEVGELLGLKVRTGVRETFVGTSGRAQVVYYHDLMLGFRSGNEKVEYESRVGFSRLPADVAGLLGQIGLFDHFTVTLSQPRLEVILRTD